MLTLTASQAALTHLRYHGNTPGDCATSYPGYFFLVNRRNPWRLVIVLFVGFGDSSHLLIHKNESFYRRQPIVGHMTTHTGKKKEPVCVISCW